MTVALQLWIKLITWNDVTTWPRCETYSFHTKMPFSWKICLAITFQRYCAQVSNTFNAHLLQTSFLSKCLSRLSINCMLMKTEKSLSYNLNSNSRGKFCHLWNSHISSNREKHSLHVVSVYKHSVDVFFVNRMTFLCTWFLFWETR